jgi:hypothetical protein
MWHCCTLARAAGGKDQAEEALHLTKYFAIEGLLLCFFAE